MIDIDKINALTMTNIVFYDSEKVLKNLKYINYIFAQDGMFILQKSNWGETLSKLNIPYSNAGLKKFGVDNYFKCNIKPPSKNILEEILEIFKYVQKKSKEEIMVNLYWDKLDKKFILDIPNEQIISGTLVQYVYNKEYEMSERYIKYLQIHSHHSMPASFSGIDDKDENSKLLCFYGVIGNINENSTIHNMGNRFRIWSGEKFLYIDIDDVFDIPKGKSLELPNETKLKLDLIVASSEVKNKIKGISAFPKRNRFFVKDEFLDEDALLSREDIEWY